MMVKEEKTLGTKDDIETLIDMAVKLGATEAAFVPLSEVKADQKFADFCREPRCPNYGAAASCPPYVTGPAEFLEKRNNAAYALLYKMDVPAEIMMSSDRIDIYRLLHEISAELERNAIRMGYPQSAAYAGGSCKNLFCREENDCLVVSKKGVCRHPESARPSMSGFGVNVMALCKSAGWHMEKITKKTKADEVKTAMAIGLLLII